MKTSAGILVKLVIFVRLLLGVVNTETVHAKGLARIEITSPESAQGQELVNSWRVAQKLPPNLKLNPGILDEITRLSAKNIDGAPLDMAKLFDNGFDAVLKNLDEAEVLRRLQRMNDWEPKWVDDLANKFGKSKYDGIVEDLQSKELFDLYDEIARNPLKARDLVKHLDAKDGVFDKVGKSVLFQELSAIGKKFEGVASKGIRPGGGWRNRLKELLDEKFGVKNLDEYEMVEQVQLIYDGEKYFVADQVFVKYGLNSKNEEIIEDIIIIENKLSQGTKLTTNQEAAKKVTSYSLRGDKLRATEVSFNNGEIKWAKVYDSTNGDEIIGITDEF